MMFASNFTDRFSTFSRRHYRKSAKLDQKESWRGQIWHAYRSQVVLTIKMQN